MHFKQWFRLIRSGKYKQYEKHYQDHSQFDYYHGKPETDYQQGYDQAYRDQLSQNYLNHHPIMHKVFNYYVNRRSKRSLKYQSGYQAYLKQQEQKQR